MKKTSMKIAVLGDGAWGTALALNLHRNHHQVAVWSAFAENAEYVTKHHENKKFLPGVKIPADILYTPDMGSIAGEADLILLGTPSQYLRGTLMQLKKYIQPERQMVVNIAKGIEVKTHLRMSQLCEEILGPTKYTAISGPSHAEEVSRNIPTLVTAASKDIRIAKKIQSIFMNEYFRVYTSSDLVGVELGGALKNVYAVAAGILDGIGLGDNTKAALMTRGIVELARLGVKLGGRKSTFSGLSGIGDLIVTCTSKHSRNRFVGEELGKGRKLDEIIQSMNGMVAEGVKTCESAKELADSVNVETPLVSGVYEVLFHNRPAKEIIFELMTRKAKVE